MANKQNVDLRIGILVTCGVAIGFVIYKAIELLTDFQDQLSSAINMVIACTYGLLVGIVSRYTAKAILRTRDKRESNQQS